MPAPRPQAYLPQVPNGFPQVPRQRTSQDACWGLGPRHTYHGFRTGSWVLRRCSFRDASWGPDFTHMYYAFRTRFGSSCTVRSSLRKRTSPLQCHRSIWSSGLAVAKALCPASRRQPPLPAPPRCWSTKTCRAAPALKPCSAPSWCPHLLMQQWCSSS